MKRNLLTMGALLICSSAALAVDHDGVDAGRPLEFDDAETIAWGEKAVEVGAALVRPSTGRTGLALEGEYLYGFARNWQAEVGLGPSYLSGPAGSRRWDTGDLTLGLQHNFNRETVGRPALGASLKASLPTGRGSRGVDWHLRGIMSRQGPGLSRFHLNLDLDLDSRPQAGLRRTRPGAILGYSRPLGYPTRFDRTLVAQVGYRAARQSGAPNLLNLGVGLRQQVTPRSVLDLGVLGDLTGSSTEKENWRVVLGYSSAF